MSEMTLLTRVGVNPSAVGLITSAFSNLENTGGGIASFPPLPPIFGTSDLAAGLETITFAADVSASRSCALKLSFGDPFVEFVGPVFPSNSLPSNLEHFVNAQHFAMGADQAALAMAVLTCVAGAVHGETCVRMGDGWWEKPILWTALVGLPSTMKSPIIDKATKPLVRIDHQLDQLWRQKNASWQTLNKGSGKNTVPRPPQACP